MWKDACNGVDGQRTVSGVVDGPNPAAMMKKPRDSCRHGEQDAAGTDWWRDVFSHPRKITRHLLITRQSHTPHYAMVAIVTVIAIAILMVLSPWHCHCESSPGSFDECSTILGGCRPLDEAHRPEPPIRLNWHSPLPFITTQLEGWYSWRVKSWVDLGWSTCQQTVQVLAGPGVE